MADIVENSLPETSGAINLTDKMETIVHRIYDLPREKHIQVYIFLKQNGINMYAEREKIIVDFNTVEYTEPFVTEFDKFISRLADF